VLPYPLASESLTRALRVLAEHPPATLSRYARSFRGDLDTIFRKALEKDPVRRYASAAALRDDLRRFRRHEPISARPPSATYQLRQFARRHRGLMVGVCVAVFALFSGTIASAVWPV
jgi:hypothetical protein